MDEIHLLQRVQRLSNELIFRIYEYMTGKAKFLCNKKYEYLEKNVKDDYKKKYVFWKFLNTKFEFMTKEKMLKFIRHIILPQHASVIDRIWYHSKEHDVFYTGEDLLQLWEKDDVDIVYFSNSRIALNNHINLRIVDAIYYYILQHISIFTSNQKVNKIHPLYQDSPFLDYSEVFHNNDKIHRLCKSIELIKT